MKSLTISLLFCMSCFLMGSCVKHEKVESPEATANQGENEVVDKLRPTDSRTGLIIAKGMDLVQTNCTPCHSAKLISQNRADREGWESMIRWMQETQNLWQLGDNEDTILDYLSTYYAPEETGRRKNLENIEWYELNPSDN